MKRVIVNSSRCKYTTLSLNTRTESHLHCSNFLLEGKNWLIIDSIPWYTWKIGMYDHWIPNEIAKIMGWVVYGSSFILLKNLSLSMRSSEHIRDSCWNSHSLSSIGSQLEQVWQREFSGQYLRQYISSCKLAQRLRQETARKSNSLTWLSQLGLRPYHCLMGDDIASFTSLSFARDRLQLTLRRERLESRKI